MINFGDLGDIVEALAMMKYFSLAIQIFHVPFTKWILLFVSLDLARRLIGRVMEYFSGIRSESYVDEDERSQ